MTNRKETGLTTKLGIDPLRVLRQMTTDLDRMFQEPGWPPFRWPIVRAVAPDATEWMPGIDVFERDNRLITRIDLPGMKKEDVKVEVTDGRLTISGERKMEAEEKKEEFYRCERGYGRFFRSVPLPDGVKFEEVKATITDGVLEVSVPLPAPAEAKMQNVEIQDGQKPAKAA